MRFVILRLITNMANRSDFQSDFPRSLKRMLAMEQAYGWVRDNQERGELKRLWRAAHTRHRDYVNKRGTMAVGQNVDESSE
jgi:muconolactone delta-isomerase